MAQTYASGLGVGPTVGKNPYWFWTTVFPAEAPIADMLSHVPNTDSHVGKTVLYKHGWTDDLIRKFLRLPDVDHLWSHLSPTAISTGVNQFWRRSTVRKAESKMRDSLAGILPSRIPSPDYRRMTLGRLAAIEDSRKLPLDATRAIKT